MQVKEIVVEMSCNASPRSYNNIQCHVRLAGVPEDGESLADVLETLSTQVRTQFVADLRAMTAQMTTSERKSVFSLVGIEMPADPERVAQTKFGTTVPDSPEEDDEGDDFEDEDEWDDEPDEEDEDEGVSDAFPRDDGEEGDDETPEAEAAI